jgi:ribonuclease VapC
VIVDTSALVAVLLDEPEAPAMARAMAAAPACRISAATYLELAVVVDGRRDPTLSGAIDSLLRRGRIEIAPFTGEQARLARMAYREFGRGSGHPAQLNMGDCFSYALARDLGEPLLFKGGDFALTDIELVVEPVRERRLSEVLAAYTAATEGR